MVLFGVCQRHSKVGESESCGDSLAGRASQLKGPTVALLDSAPLLVWMSSPIDLRFAYMTVCSLNMARPGHFIDRQSPNG